MGSIRFWNIYSFTCATLLSACTCIFVWDLMRDLVTCKFDNDPIKNERASVETIRILHGREVQTETENSVQRSLFGITRLLRPEGHHLASRGCAEWCKTVIPRDGIFYPRRTLMSCIHFDSECFIVKVAFITTQNDVGIGHFFLKLTSMHCGVLYNQCKPNPRDNFLFLSMGETSCQCTNC